MLLRARLLLKPFGVDQLDRALVAALDTSGIDARVPADPSRDSPG